MLIDQLQNQDFAGSTNTIKNLFEKTALRIVDHNVVIDKPIMAGYLNGMHEIYSISTIKNKLIAKYDEVILDEFGYETKTYEIDLNDPEDLKHYLLFVCELVDE